LLRGTSNMDTLIAMGASVAYGYSLIALIGALAGRWNLPHLYFTESTGLLALISLGHWLEARARDQAGSAIHELLNLTPAVALRIRRGEGEAPSEPSSLSPQSTEVAEVPVSALHKPDHLLVGPRDRTPTHLGDDRAKRLQRADHRLPLRPGPGRPRHPDGRHRPRRKTRHPHPRHRRPAKRRAHRHSRPRQDRHHHQRQTRRRRH